MFFSLILENENGDQIDMTAKEILDSITAPYTAEEKKKLAGISPETYATNEYLNEQILLVRESMTPLEYMAH